MSSSDKVRPPVAVAIAAELWRDQEFEIFATKQARLIFTEILPDVLERFLVKNADYGDETAAFLGAKGQFADINPKFWKLKRALWDGEPLNGEPLEEILADLVGHCLLTLHFLELERKSAIEPQPAKLDAPLLPHNHEFGTFCSDDCPRAADEWKKP